MNDLSSKLPIAVAFVVVFGGYLAWEVYAPRVFRKASGADASSSWQPAAALSFAVLLLVPVASRLTVGWPPSAFGLFYAAYATALMTLVLIFSASSSSFQRFAFAQQPVPAGVARRFAFGVLFFLCLSVASTFGYLYFA